MYLGMMKSKLVENEFLERPAAWDEQSPPLVVPNPLLPEDFVQVSTTVYTIQHVTTWPLTRPFLWLPYIPGKVSCIPLGGEDILTLTGKMSGCWVVIFTLKSTGQRFVGHIGTSDSNSTQTLAAKKAWRNAVEKDKVIPKKAYNPFDRNKFKLDPLNKDLGSLEEQLKRQNLMVGETAEYYGGIEADGSCSTVILAKGTTRLYRTGRSRRVALVYGWDNNMPDDVIGF
jgi:hypothetical protein